MVDILANNLLNIMVLETIYETGSLNYNLIIRKMKEKTGDDIFNINQNMVVTSALSTFTSLFSYANDDVYKNNNKYTLLECDGLDYSKLDLSLIKVSKNTIDMGNINDLIDKRNAKQKEIITIKNKINKTNNDLENVRKSNNTKAIEVLSNNLGKLYVLQSKNANEYNKIVNEINVWNYYYNNSKLYLENESIISGIRNSISHGHYEISLGSSLLDTKIIFNNIGTNASLKYIPMRFSVNLAGSGIFDTNSKKILNLNADLKKEYIPQLKKISEIDELCQKSIFAVVDIEKFLKKMLELGYYVNFANYDYLMKLSDYIKLLNETSFTTDIDVLADFKSAELKRKKELKRENLE